MAAIGTEPDGRAALVTGAASGIGRAITRRFASLGMDVTAVDIARFDAQDVSRATGSGRILPFTADVGDASQMHDAVQAGVDAFGRLDVVVPAAAILRTGRLLDMTHEDRDAVVRVNLMGVWNTIEMSLPSVLASDGPRRILVCGSVGSVVADAGFAAYVMAKHGLLGLVKAVALEHAADGVTVNVISPAAVDTPMINAEPGSAEYQRLVRTTPVRRLSTPSELAAYFEFLASEEAGYMTGANIIVDGGASIINSHSKFLEATPT